MPFSSSPLSSVFAVTLIVTGRPEPLPAPMASHCCDVKTGKPEPVFTSQQWATLTGSKGSGQPITVNVESRTYLDGREVGGVIDERINIYDGEVARDLNNGRWG